MLKSYSSAAIKGGSKSFAIASRLFSEDMRADAQMLYAWCRHCDDVIDGQSLGGDAPNADLTVAERAARLERLISETKKALANEPSSEASFEAFRYVARKHKFPEAYPLDLLEGFSHDIEPRVYQSIDDLLDYCYGVAGVVGVMMAIIMGVHRDDIETLDRACDLGLAFQLTNICRDILDDASAGRVYLPKEFLAIEGLDATPEDILNPLQRERVWRAAIRQLDIAEIYYDSASEGVRRLPKRAAAAIAAARNIYRDIGEKIRAGGPEVWDKRVTVSKRRKFGLAVSGLATGVPAAMFLYWAPGNPRTDLWSRSHRPTVLASAG